MWRGQSNIDWRLDHGAYRRLKIEQANVEESDLIHYEQILLAQATHKGYRRQNGRELDDFELLARLQHHGAATRLLDFSRNSLVALWFCVSDNLGKYGLLVGLNVDYLGGDESNKYIEEYIPFIKGLANLSHPQTWEPPIVSPRIAAQHSQFIFSALSKDPRSSITLDSAHNANIFIAISPELKVMLAEILEKTFDIRLQTLFPDLDGFGNSNGASIGRHNMWRW